MKKKILFITNTMGRAGAERALVTMLNEIDPEQYEVSVRSMLPRGELFPILPKWVKILNKRYTVGSVMANTGLYFGLFYTVKAMIICFFHFKYWRQIFRYLVAYMKKDILSLSKLAWLPISIATPRMGGYDLAVAYMEGASTYFVADRVEATKKVAFVHVEYKNHGYLKDIDHRYYQKFDRIYCVSKTVQQGMEKAYPEFIDRLDWFQNMLSDSLIREKADEGVGFTDTDFDGIRLLTVGRLHHQKAYEIAIPAFRKALDMGLPKIKWYVIGEGVAHHLLTRLIKENQLEDHFILLGGVDNPYPFFKQCDIYVHCTRYEGWSLAIAEARILGKPIIASDSSKAGSQLPPGNAVITPLNPDDIAAAIVGLVNNPEQIAAMNESNSKPWTRPNDMYKLYALMNEDNTAE
jgi:glycosyltransferase involved in cell wall biosynthesis